jgi:TRAP-type C4-dicarboxylate transport system permease small subunit
MVTNINSAQTQTMPRNGFEKFNSFFNKIVDPLCKGGSIIAAVGLAAMMLITTLDVLGRYLGGLEFIRSFTTFFRPIPGTVEMVNNFMVILVSFGLGYCAFRKGHIRVDIVLQYIGKKANHWFDVYAYGICFIIYILVTWQCFNNAITHFNNKMLSPILLFPVYPWIFILVIGAAIITLTFLRDFLKSIEEVMN